MLNMIESLPMGILYIVIALLMLFFTEIGYQIGKKSLSKRDKEAANYIGAMVGGLLGMLAFVLAFTFNMAHTQHETRKQNVVMEANMIGTAYIRADLVDKQYGSQIKALLREYVDVRMKIVENKMSLEEGLSETTRIHTLLWGQITKLASNNPTVMTSLLTQSINEVIDMHDIRLTDGIYNRIPSTVWFALLFITILTMVTMGNQMGLTGKRRLAALIPLSLSFSVLVSLIIDLNRPGTGLIQVSQRSMMELQKNMDDSINQKR